MFKYTMAAFKKIADDIGKIIFIISLVWALYNIGMEVYSIIVNTEIASNVVFNSLLMSGNIVNIIFSIIVRKPVTKDLKKMRKKTKRLSKKIKKNQENITTIVNTLTSGLTAIGEVFKEILVVAAIFCLVSIALMLIKKFLEYEMKYLKNGFYQDFNGVISVINKIPHNGEKMLIEAPEEKVINKLEKYVSHKEKKTIFQLRFENDMKKAANDIEDKEKLKDLIKKAEVKYASIKNPEKSLLYVPSLITIIDCYISNKHKGLKEETIIKIVSALMYFVSPNDIINDNLPKYGYNDDMDIINCCLATEKETIDSFVSTLKIKKA